jgi:hypothetical protein
VSITVDYALNTDRKEVYDFLIGHDDTWTDQPPRCPGYTYAEVLKDLGSLGPSDLQPAPPGGKIALIWGIREEWTIWEGADASAKPPKQGTLVASFSVNVPMEQSIQIGIKAALYIKDGIDPTSKDKIKIAFTAFDPARNIDPDDYVQSKITADPPSGLSARRTSSNR